MNVEKKRAHVCPIFSKPEKTSWSLTPQLDTVIIVLSVKVVVETINTGPGTEDRGSKDPRTESLRIQSLEGCAAL